MIIFIAAIAGATQAASGQVSFRIANDALVVDCKVNGHPVSLMFDSGFGGSVVLSSSIDVGPSTGEMHLRDFVGEITAKTVKLSSLQIGDQTVVPDEDVIVQQPANFTSVYGQHVDGILGLSAVKSRVTQVDFQNHKLAFYPSSYDISRLVPDNKTTFLVKMLPIGGNAIELPVVTGTGQTMTMALDTGNAFYATTHKDVLQRVGLWDEGKKPSFVRESGVASGMVDSWSFLMPPATIFGVPVQSTVWDVIDLPSSDVQGDGTVGFGFLSHFKVTFDYARRRVWFELWDKPVENPAPGDIGISAHFDRTLNRTMVVLVAPGSPAEEGGVKANDEILSIDGTDMERPSFEEIRKMLEGAPGTTVKVALSRNGNLKRLSLTRKVLVNTAKG